MQISRNQQRDYPLVRTARINEGIMAGFMGKEGDDICCNKNMDVIVIVRRE